MSRLSKTQKLQIAWTRLEDTVSTLYWMLVACGTVGGIFAFLVRMDVFSATFALTVWTFGISSFLTAMIIVFILLFILVIALAFTLKPQNYYRLIPLMLGVVILTVLWFFLLLGVTMDYPMWISSVNSIIFMITTVIVGVIVNMCYRHIRFNDLSRWDAAQMSFMRKHKTMTTIIVAFPLTVLFIFILLLFVF